MRPLYRNIFLLFGLIAISVMLYTLDIDFSVWRDNRARVWMYFPAVVGIWVFVYFFNAVAFRSIVNSMAPEMHLSLAHSYKLTVSGFAFSYTTPFGFGGGPYRVMELASHIGTVRAISSVALYSMMHILSHFCFWATGAVLFMVCYTEKMTPFLWTLFALFGVVVVLVVGVFNFFYRKGVIVRLFKLFFYVPFLRHWARPFFERKGAAMEEVDANIAYLHSRPRIFYASLAYEYVARIVNSLEFFFILHAFGQAISFADAILILAFSSLVGNILFFFPMQLGAREGGLVVIVKILAIPAGGIGLFAGFYTRLRELFWIIVGTVWVKFGNKHLMRPREEL